VGTTGLEEEEEEELNLRLITNFVSGSYNGKINRSTSSCPVPLSYVLISSSHISLGLPISFRFPD
jgi:hypothetical protein